MKTRNTRISIFSQSLFALPLSEAIETTARIGFPAIELACVKPHFDMSIDDPDRVAGHIRETGLEVSALSLFNNFTDEAHLDEQIQKAESYIRLAPLFQAKVLKMTPGPPGSADATEDHWRCVSIALEHLMPVAEEIGVRLAFETHMRQLTDTLAGSRRLLEIARNDVVGLTVDFSNLTFAGESMSEVFSALTSRMYNTHLKNGRVGQDGSWHFSALDDGLTDYTQVFSLLRDADYAGYLTIECLSPDARDKPAETARKDLDILKDYLRQVGY